MAALLGACTPSTTLLSPDGRNSVAFDAATMTYAVLRDGDRSEERRVGKECRL